MPLVRAVAPAHWLPIRPAPPQADLLVQTLCLLTDGSFAVCCRLALLLRTEGSRVAFLLLSLRYGNAVCLSKRN